MPNTENILSVRNLNISISSTGGNLGIIKDAEFDLKRGTTVGIIGESGSGKSILSKGLLRLLPNNSIITGNIFFSPDKDNTFDILALSDDELRAIRGKKIGFLSQEPSSSMNPVRKCGKQIYDALPDSLRANVRGGKSRVLELLELTGLNEPASVSDSYPHELSGGMLQRVALAAALAGEPDILIADEPTTALDASSRVGIMKTIAKLKTELNLSTLLVSHDIDFIADWIDDLMVMYLGQIVEFGTAEKMFSTPAHPYTKALMDVSKSYTLNSKPIPIRGEMPSIDNKIGGCKFHPRCDNAQDKCSHEEPLIEIASHGGQKRCFFPVTE